MDRIEASDSGIYTEKKKKKKKLQYSRNKVENVDF